MKNEGGRYTPQSLIWAVRLLALIAGVAMVSTGECEWLFIAVFFCFFLLGLKMSSLARLSRVLAVAQTYLAILVFLISLVDFFYLSNSFLLAVGHFLLCLQGLQLLVLRTPRENLGCILISSLMILSASTLAVEWTFFALLTLYLPILIWTLMLHTLVNEIQIIPADEKIMHNHPLDRESPRWRRMAAPLRRSSFMAFMIAIGCCAFVFVTFPRFNFRGFRGQFLQPVRKTGFTNQVDLSRTPKIYSDNTIAMRVEIDPNDIEIWNGYMRGATLELFDGRYWKKAPYPVERVYQTSRGVFFLPSRYDDTDRRLRQKIYLESMDSTLLFAAARPAYLEIDRPVIELSSDGSIHRTLGDSWRIHYQVDSYLPKKPAPHAIAETTGGVMSPSLKSKIKNRRLFGVPPGLEFYSTSLPKKPMEKIKTLAKEITVLSKNDFQAAQSIENYLHRNFTYSLGFTPTDLNQNPVEAFLFDQKKGHCEYFASAMCLMLRYCGIPARIVTGFYSREWNDQGGYFVVRMKNAHAWVEAYIEPHGWVAWDPTPQSDSETVFDSPWTKRWEETWDFLNLRWNRYILSYDFERQKSIVESVVDRSGHLSGRLSNMGAAFRSLLSRLPTSKSLSFFHQRSRSNNEKTSLPLGLILALGSGIGLILCVAWRYHHKERVWFYGPLLRYLESKGGKKPPYLTLHEFGQSLKDQLGSNFSDIQILQEKYYACRFDSARFFSDNENNSIRDILKRLK